VRRIALVLGFLGLVSCSREPPIPPDIVLITVDTLRADRLGCYGYFRDTSPRIDAFAEQSVLFERAIPQCATTLPSHISLMTSTYLGTHGVRGNLWSFRTKLETTGPLQTLAERLKALGYDTGGFVSATPVKQATGISVGFDSWSEPDSSERRAEETVDLALEWLAQERATPFFLWLHLFDPHEPYKPPAPFDSLFATDETLINHLRENAYTHWEDSWIQQANGKYDGEVRYMDGQLGRLFDWLETRDAFANTACVLTSDQGEGLGQHGRMSHNTLNTEQLHIPLIMRLPGDRIAPQRYSAPIALVDVVPTLFNACSLPLPSEGIEGQDAFGSRRTYVMSERTRGARKVSKGLQFALTGLEWKLIHNTELPDELFHLAEDPLETRNVVETNPDVAEHLLGELLLRVPETDAVEITGQLSAEHVEELRTLGYVE